MPVLICLREKLWTRTYYVGDQVPTCPVFTRAKIKVLFWDFSQFAVTIYIYICVCVYIHIRCVLILKLQHTGLNSKIKSQYILMTLKKIIPHLLSFIFILLHILFNYFTLILFIIPRLKLKETQQIEISNID